MTCDHILGDYSDVDGGGYYRQSDRDAGEPEPARYYDAFDYCPRCGTRLTPRPHVNEGSLGNVVIVGAGAVDGIVERLVQAMARIEIQSVVVPEWLIVPDLRKTTTARDDRRHWKTNQARHNYRGKGRA